ncbi:diaminopimelate epimerase [Candidatus Altiarchaeota archaeon]
MMKKIGFTKMHGAGNDFMIINEWEGEAVPEAEKPAMIAKACDRHFGVGGDGVIFIRRSDSVDARFHFFNPDGSIAEMCGNGIRCFAKYLYENDIVRKETILAETLAGVLELKLTITDGNVSSVRVLMGAPQIARGKAQVATGELTQPMISEEVTIEGNTYELTVVGMGNPHAIMFVKDVDKSDVTGDGHLIRNERQVFPNGTNVHFVEEAGYNKFRIRTYERGVEDETLACGTGICASAVAAVLTGRAEKDKQITFEARGGTITIDLESTGQDITGVYMTGPAETVFTGTILID